MEEGLALGFELFFSRKVGEGMKPPAHLFVWHEHRGVLYV